jgi:molybdopterin-biosynthesis enzyme MoeA-like protein
MMTTTLEVDHSGQLWICVESDIVVTDTCLGAVDDDATAERVPAALIGRLEELRAEWAAATANRVADRDEADACYRRNTL